MSPERVHFNQNEDTSAKYKVNIESATFDAGARKVTVKYSLTDPTNGNAAYNLVTSDCTGSAPNVSCSSSTRFGNLQFYLTYPNLVGQPTAVTEFTSYNNGGSGAKVYLYTGTNDGSNHYTADISLPADSATAIAQGTARVVGVGQIKDAKLEVKSASDPRPEVTPRTLVNVVVQHTFADVVLSGALNPRAPGRREPEVQRLPRGAGHDVGLQHQGRSVPRRSAQHGRGVRDLPRPGPLLVDGDGQWPGAERELRVQAHDPRHPRQLEADLPVYARQ